MEAHLKQLLGRGGSSSARRRRINANVAERINSCYAASGSQFIAPSSSASNTNPSTNNIVGSQTGFNIVDPDVVRLSENIPSEVDIASNNSDYDYDFVSSSGDDDDDESDSEQSDLTSRLRDWAISHAVELTTLTDLLQILTVHHASLPRDARTLLKTPRTMKLQVLSGGQYYHFGVENCIRDQIKNGAIDAGSSSDKQLSLQFNIDGMQVFKSSCYQLWPILMRVKESKQVEPVTVAIFAGNKKPDNSSDYLQQFVEEMQQLDRNGIQTDNGRFTVIIHSFVCDAPARAYLKCITGHTGYYACERCTQKGVYASSRMTFCCVTSELRTDERFREMKEDAHQKGKSPLASLKLGLVSAFPLDYMHLVCLGVVRRLIYAWTKTGSRALNCRISSHQISTISQRLISMRSSIPSEFARQPRSLIELDRWKATEFRQFLLYTGVVALYKILSPDLYNNFVILSVAIRILTCPLLCSGQYGEYARQLLVTFVKQTEILYGADFIVYNVHSLIHLADDVKRFGSLDGISAFPFENHLKSIKRLVKQPNKPLEQIVRRLKERKFHASVPCLSNQLQSIGKYYVKNCHSNGPLPDKCKSGTVEQYQFIKLSTDSFCLSTIQERDNCFLTKSGKCCVVRNIIVCRPTQMTGDGVISVVCEMFINNTNYFVCPLESKKMSIYKVNTDKTRQCTIPITNVSAKCLLIKIHDSSCSIVIPMLHHQ